MSDGEKVISVQCNHCGAPLDVEEATRFATCAHCGSKLQITHSGSAYFSTVLERLDRTTQDMADDLETIRLQNELERIDREWQMQRQTYAVRDKDGNVTYPSGPVHVVGGVVGIVFGILWTILASAITGSAPDVGPFRVAKLIFPLFGILFIALAAWTLIRGSSAARDYADAEASYRARREAVQRRIATEADAALSRSDER